MTVEPLRERVFPVVDRTLPLDRPPVYEFPQWGQWLETPDLIAARLAPGQLEVNLVAPFTFISTRFAPGHGLAAFDSDQLHPYRSQPGGFDVVPQGSSYRSTETTGVCILLAYKQPIADRILAEYTDGAAIELHPGQLQASTQGTKLAQALQVFFAERSAYWWFAVSRVVGNADHGAGDSTAIKRIWTAQTRTRLFITSAASGDRGVHRCASAW
jgi:hypothetical protein